MKVQVHGHTVDAGRLTGSVLIGLHEQVAIRLRQTAAEDDVVVVSLRASRHDKQ